MRSGNTVLKKANENAYSEAYSGESASYLGVGLKTLFFLAMTIVGCGLGIFLAYSNPNAYIILIGMSGILGFISALVAMNKPNLSFSFGTVYCIMEGMLLGVVSLIFEAAYNGIVLTAVVSTIAVVLACAFVYITGIIKVNNVFYKFLFIFAIGFLISMFLITLLSLFGLRSFDSFGFSVMISALSILLASIFLISDMNYAATIVENNGPKELEWMVSFGLAYTILWIYYEILRLLIMIFGRRD